MLQRIDPIDAAVYPFPALLKNHGLALGFIMYNGTIGVSVIFDPNIMSGDKIHQLILEEIQSVIA